jgi:predicted ester cyclase
MSNLATQELVAKGFAYLNERKLDAFLELYSNDLHNPTLAAMGLPTNKQGFKSFISVFYESFGSTQFLPQKVLCEGDTAIFHWVFKGQHTGEFNGVKPSGKRVEIDAFVRFRVASDGKVIEQFDCADLPTLMRQIGASA